MDALRIFEFLLQAFFGRINKHGRFLAEYKIFYFYESEKRSLRDRSGVSS